MSLTYTYDGSLLTRTTWSGPVTGTVERTWDNDFRVISEKVNGGTPVTYQYDADGLLVKAGDLTITRDLQTGLVTATTLGAVTTANAYNTFGELIHQEAKTSGNPIFTADYTRDLLGRITRKVEVIEGVTDTWDYAYDPAGRLQEVYRNGGRLSRYEYDANGNRVAHITPTETITATYDDQDRLLTYGDITYTYTANGELATKTQNGQTVQYQYDELGNLVKVTMPDGLEIEYVIDGQGRRVGKKVNGVQVKGLLYQDQLEPIAELNGPTLESRWIYAATSHSPDVLLKGGQTYRLIADHLGSPRLVVNVTDGTVVQRMDYDEFGRTILDTGAGSQVFGFAGGVYDGQTGLVRFGARDYDAGVGRWGAKDPSRLSGGTSNFYDYSLNDPVNVRDVSGLGWIWNYSFAPVPYKPESQDNAPPQILNPGQGAFVDGLYSPEGTREPIVLKVPDNCAGIITPCGTTNVACIGLKGLLEPIPGIVTSDDFKADRNFDNWPNPYSGDQWPYPRWPASSK